MHIQTSPAHAQLVLLFSLLSLLTACPETTPEPGAGAETTESGGSEGDGDGDPGDGDPGDGDGDPGDGDGDPGDGDGDPGDGDGDPGDGDGDPGDGDGDPGDGDGDGDGDTGDGDGDPGDGDGDTGDGDGDAPGVCGDGVVDEGELCDDGNEDETDACTSLCAPPACDDMLVSGDETDLDCGGSCGPCGAGLGCLGDIDCASGSCGEEQSCLADPFVVGGGMHTCVLLRGDDVARCWGSGFLGELGYGIPDQVGDDEPAANAPYVEAGGPIVAIDAGRGDHDAVAHTCAVLEGGAVRCWGENDRGQLGYGHTETIGDDELPASVDPVDVGGVVTQIACGSEHNCVLLEDGHVRCWGDGGSGQLGYANTESIGDDEPPSSAGDVELGGVAVQVVTGSWHSCALLDDGTVRCWGWGGVESRLGYGNGDEVGAESTPASAGPVPIGRQVVQLAAGADHTCALTVLGSVRCWGLNEDGWLGYGPEWEGEIIGDDETPAEVGDVELGGVAVQLAAGEGHTCAVLEGGGVRCWGANVAGVLGYPGVQAVGIWDVPADAPLVDVGGPVTQLAAGGWFNCAVLAEGAIRCWGDNHRGQLGHGNTLPIGDDETPASAGDVPYL